MNFSKPKPTPITIPLWTPDLIAKRVNKFRTESSSQYFDVLARSEGVFHVNSVSRDSSNAGWVFVVDYVK